MAKLKSTQIYGDLDVTGNIRGNHVGNSETATKLQTARTINGTSFDGSANITTSKWGTARTLSLTGGVTGSASIDGSGNVSLSTTIAGTAPAATKLATARTINGTSFDGSGNITTANWGTSRTITIGNTGKSVNGSGNVSWNLSEIGALPLAGGTLTGSVKFSGGGYNNHAIRLEAGDSNGAFIGIGAGGLTVIGSGESTNAVRTALTDGADETMIVASDQSIRFLTGVQNGYGSAKEISINSAGVLNAPQGITGNTSTATKLQTARSINGTNFDGSANITTANWGTARTITIGNTGKSVNGSANITWSLSEIGAAAASHTHSYLSLSGGTMTGAIQMNNQQIKLTSANSSYARIGFDSETNDVYISNYNNNWFRIKPDKTITIAGSKVYTAIDKPTPSEIGAAASSHTHNYAGSSSAGGNANAAVKLATARSINGTNFDGTGNITTANWGTARNLQIGNTSKSVNGSANVTWTLAEIGALPLAGGTLTGSITLPNSTNGQIKQTLSTGTVTPTLYITSSDNLRVGSADIENVCIYSKTNPKTAVNGSTYTLYHTGNKPTANDVGALPLSGGTITGTVTFNSSPKLSNDKYINSIDTSGSPKSVLGITTSNNCIVGSPDVALRLRTNSATGAAVFYNSNAYPLYHTGNKPTAKDVGALPLSGGDMTGAIKSNLTCSHLDGFKGKSLISSTAGAGSHVAVAKTNSNKGYFTLIGYQDYAGVTYATKTKVDGGTNGFDHFVKLLDESGWSTFKGIKLDNSSEADLRLICGSRDTGLYLNTNNFGIHDWQNNTTIVRYNYGAKKLELNGDTVVIGGKRAVVMDNYDYNYKIRGGSGLSGADGYITFSW